ncbi:MAG: PAS domain S-box protein, partial [Anaerolineae bacterium]|nr:PAS domain S-box protein [Anaerolineae bacterium]
MIPSTDSKSCTLAHNLPDYHILVVTETVETHNLVKQACERLNDQKLTCLWAASVEDAGPILRNQPDITLIFLNVTLHNNQVSPGVIKQIRSAAQNQSVQIILSISQADAATVEKIVQEAEIDSVIGSSNLTVERLALDLTVALHNYQQQMMLEAEDKALREREAIQKQHIDTLKQRVRENTQFKATLEATSDFVGVADPTGRVFYVNEVGRKITGFEPEEDITKTIIADYHPEEANRLLREEAFPTIHEKGYWSGEVALLTPNRDPIITSQVIIAQKTEDGEVEFFATIARDITNYKRLQASLQEQEKFLQLIVDNIPQFIVWKDCNLTFLGANQNFVRVNGLTSPQEVIGKTGNELLWKKETVDFFYIMDKKVI